MKEIFLMVVKELRYLLLDKGVYARDYSDGALYKPRGIWWLGRNRFIRFVASVVFKAKRQFRQGWRFIRLAGGPIG